MPSFRCSDVEFAVVDVETTGLFPQKHDRVVEIAVVRTRLDGTVVDDYVTLVNPQRDVGPTTIHGINATDVALAPTFWEIAGDVADRLDGAVIVAHNARFDHGFLAAEYARMQAKLPDVPVLCTMRLAQKFGSGFFGRSLLDCCGALGIDIESQHSAGCDARATAQLLTCLARQAHLNGSDLLSELVCGNIPWFWHTEALPRTGRRVQRHEVRDLQAGPDPFLSRLVYRVAGNLHDPRCNADQTEYLAFLDRVLEDRCITEAEADLLFEVATRFQLSAEHVVQAHRVYLGQLCRAALADSHLSECELRDLQRVSRLFGFDDDALQAELQRAQGVTRPNQITSTCEDVAGKTVCFTGELISSINGCAITRDRAQQLAANAGLVIKGNISKALDILVVADPATQSGKAKKAREYGIRIVHEPLFWRMIGVAVD